MLTSETTEAADWGAAKKKVPGTHSKNVFDITEFQGHESPSPATPMQQTVHQLTDACQGTRSTDAGRLPGPRSSRAAILLPWATGASAAGKKRKRVDGDDSDAASSDKNEAEDDDNEDEGDDSP